MACAGDTLAEELPTGATFEELCEGSPCGATAAGTADEDRTGLSNSGDESSSKASDVTGGGDASGGAVGPSEAAAAETAASSGGEAAGSHEAPPVPTTLKGKIALLKEEQRALRASSKAKTREIRNTERKSKRLKAKVGCLTDEDLNEVLRARAEAKAMASAKAKAGPTGGTTPGQSRSPALRPTPTAKATAGPGSPSGLKRPADRDAVASPDLTGLRQRLESRTAGAA